MKYNFENVASNNNLIVYGKVTTITAIETIIVIKR